LAVGTMKTHRGGGGCVIVLGMFRVFGRGYPEGHHCSQREH